MAVITYCWIESEEDWEKVDRLMQRHGWSLLNKETSKVLLAKDGEEIVGFQCLQLMPFCGPLFVVRAYRGTGIADKLAADSIELLTNADARGWFVVADSPHVPKLCEKHGMYKVTSPVYITLGTGVRTEVA